MKKIAINLFLVALLVITLISFNSCARSCQSMKANGSFIGSTNGDWVVVKQSGGDITDVYLLENVMVQSETGSDGWLFIDQNGNPVHIGGDMKAIRIAGNKQEMFNKYIEYHMEFENISYQEKFAQVRGIK